MKKNNLYKLAPFLFAIATLIYIFAPYQTDSTLGNDFTRNILRIAMYLCGGTGFFISMFPYFCRKSKIDKSRAIFLLAFATFYFFTIFHTYSGTINISGFLALILCIGFGLLTDNYQSKTYRYFKNMWVIICVISTACYLAYTFNLPIPYSKVSYYTLIHFKTDSYINYGITFLYESGKYVRLCGVCNEPGYFGTICALMLCIGGINLKQWKNIIIFVTGLLTFSFAFFLIILIFLLLKSWKSWKTFGIILMLLIAYIYVIPNIETNNDNINYLIGRFNFNEEGFAGDDRSNEKLDNLFEYSIQNHPIIGFGKGYVGASYIGGNLTYKIWIIEYGILSCTIIWGLLFISAIIKNKGNIEGVLYIIVFFISIYQRPEIMNLPYMLLLNGGIIYIHENNYKSKELKTKEL